MEKLIWKDINNYEGYYKINENGNVVGISRTITRSDGVIMTVPERNLIWTDNSDGYPTVHLSKDGKNERIAVHRLVALAFCPNPYNYPEVNHIDCNRKNPYYKNLEWVTHQDNIKHSHRKGNYQKPYYRGGGNPRARAVRIVGVDQKFNSIGECAEYLIQKGYTSGSVDNARSEILKAAKRNKKYLGLNYKFI